MVTAFVFSAHPTGADMVFPEGLETLEEFQFLSRTLRSECAAFTSRRILLLANMTEYGRTAPIPVHALAAAGYDVVIFPVTTLRVAMGAVTAALTRLRIDGAVATDGMQSRDQLYTMLRYRAGEPWRYPSASAGSVVVPPAVTATTS